MQWYNLFLTAVKIILTQQDKLVSVFFSECDSCQKDFNINCLEWCKNYWLPQQQNFTRYSVRININSSTFDLKTIYAIDVLR